MQDSEHAHAGLAALEAGRASEARALLEIALASGHPPAAISIGHAMACLALADHQAAELSLDRALAIEPRNLWAQVLKADARREAGDLRAAAAYYRRALDMAPPVDQLPAPLAAALGRARSACDTLAIELESQVRKLVGNDCQSSARFAEGLDVLFGRKRLFAETPKLFHFPGLPAEAFPDKSQFPWIGALQSATANIRKEASAILDDEAAFVPYLQSSPDRPRKHQNGLMDNPDWAAAYLWRNGEVNASIAERCPETMRALEQVPLAELPGRSPTVLFSRLRPGAHIPAHCGLINTRLIGHLPLIVPPDCKFRVGNEVRHWREGEAWLFNDTIEHEAWNNSLEPRVILLFEVWRPELSAGERRAVQALFRALDEVGAATPAWEI